MPGKFLALSAGLLIGAPMTLAVAAESAPTKSESTSTKSEPSSMVIVLDPGHGGHDTGASNGEVLESNIALKITKLVGARLEKAGLKVIYTREKDEWVSLENRALIANRAKADLFVSIHLNSSTDTRAQGKEFYFQNQVPVDEEALFLANRENNHEQHRHPASVEPGSDRVALAGLRAAEAARLPDLTTLATQNPRVRQDVKSILEDLDRSARVKYSSDLAIQLNNEWTRLAPEPGLLRTTGRAIRQAPFFLVSHVAMPSVLVEVGFLSHKREGARLTQDAYQTALAESLANGIRKWTNVQTLTVPQTAP